MKVSEAMLKDVIREVMKKWTFSDTDSQGGAYTLSPEDIGTNKSGWTIEGEIHEDWLEWVNDFSARHPQYARVWGNFENTVYADSEEGFAHFLRHHEPTAWDYADI